MKLSKHTVTPKKLDATLYNIVPLYKIQEQAKLVCHDRDQNDSCCSEMRLELGEGFFLIL